MGIQFFGGPLTHLDNWAAAYFDNPVLDQSEANLQIPQRQ